jgi:hypothetical protein
MQRHKQQQQQEHHVQPFGLQLQLQVLTQFQRVLHLFVLTHLVLVAAEPILVPVDPVAVADVHLAILRLLLEQQSLLPFLLV